MSGKISVLFSSHNNISSRFTLYPIWISKFRRKFDFYDDSQELFKKDKNQKLILTAKYFNNIATENRPQFLEHLRGKYKNLIFFEDNAGSESYYLGFLPYFDLYYKKQYYKNKGLYLKDFYGNKIFTDYYYQQHGISIDPLPEPLLKPSDNGQFHKLRLGWNLALGEYHSKKRINRPQYFQRLYRYFGPWGIGLILGKFPFDKKCPLPNLNKCQARFQYKQNRPSIDFQRNLFYDLTKDSPMFLSGRLPKKEYEAELKQVQAVLSPFGFGEVCFRDFEAILNGAILVKPDMSHIETWPDIYIPDVTYVPVSWDGHDVVEKVENLLQDPKKIESVRLAAWKALKDAYLEIDNRVEAFINEIDQLP